MNVEPQEADDRADDDRADEGQVRLFGIVEESDHQVADERKDERPAGQAIESVGQVDPVAGAHDRGHGDDDEQDGPGFDDPVGEWNRDCRSELHGTDKRDADTVEAKVILDVDGDADRHDRLPDDLVAAPDAEAGTSVEEVVNGAERPYQRQDDERRIGRSVHRVEDVGQRQDHSHEQDAAHRGRALLDQVRPRPFLADLLAHSEPVQQSDVGRHQDHDAGEGEQQPLDEHSPVLVQW